MNQEELLKNLEIELEAILLKYKNQFQSSQTSPDDFLRENYQKFDSEIAKATNDTITISMMFSAGSSKDVDFTISILHLGKIAAHKFEAFLKE